MEKEKESERSVYLFLCGAAEKRSPAAARIAKDLAGKRNLNICSFYAPIIRVFYKFKDKSSFLVKSPDLPDMNLTYEPREQDKIFVMEKYMKDLIESTGYKGDITCLNVPIHLSADEQDLDRVLKSKLEKYFDELA